MSTVTSVVTPSTKAFPRSAKARANGSTAATPIVVDAPLTVDQAVEICFEYGGSMAGADGNLTKALKQFKGQKEARRVMFRGMCIGYLVRKLGYERPHATARYDLLKHNEDIPQDDKHRNWEEQRVINSVRQMWSRADEFAGTSPEKSDRQKAALATAQVASEQAKAHREQAERAWEIVHPTEARADGSVVAETPESVIETLVRLAGTIKGYANKHSALITGDVGMAWRDWIAAAPVTAGAKPKKSNKRAK